MASLADLRQNYPQYSDLSDQQFADAFYKKYYSDMPRAEFDKSVGAKTGAADEALTPPATEKRSAAGDFIASIPGGIMKGLKGFSWLAGEITGANAQPEPPGSDPLAEAVAPKFNEAAAALPKPEGRAGRFGETVGEFVGNPASWAGPGGLLLKGGSAVAGALASEGAGQAAEFLAPQFETPARIVGGVVGGVGATAAAAERQAAKLGEALPNAEKIKAAATAGYEELKKSDVRINEQGTTDLLANIQTALHNDHFRDYLAPNTYRAIEELNVPGGATIGDLDGVRRLLGRVPVANETDRAAANAAIDAIDSFIGNMPAQYVIAGDPAYAAALLKHAQGNWAAYKRLQMVEKGDEIAEHRAGVSGSGANIQNAKRQEIRKILDSDKKSRGLSDDVKAKMEEIVMGTVASNQARRLGKFAPTGTVSATTSILTGLAGGPAAGAAVGGTGFLSKWFAEYLTERQIRQLEELMRAESPIGKPIAAAQAAEREELRQAVPASLARSTAQTTSPLAPGQ